MSDSKQSKSSNDQDKKLSKADKPLEKNEEKVTGTFAGTKRPQNSTMNSQKTRSGSKDNSSVTSKKSKSDSKSDSISETKSSIKESPNELNATNETKSLAQPITEQSIESADSSQSSSKDKTNGKSKADANMKPGSNKSDENGQKKPVRPVANRASTKVTRPVGKKTGAAANVKPTVPKKPPKPGPERFLELCKKGSWNRVTELIDETSKDNEKMALDQVDQATGWSPIMFAVKAAKIEILEKMIKYGFDVNIKTENGITALHLASQTGKDELIRMLMTAKADPLIPGGPRKEYAIHMLMKKLKGPNSSLVSLLLKAAPEEMRLAADCENYIPLLYAVEAQNTGLVRELLSVIPKAQLVVQRKKFGDTAIHIATRKHDMEMFRLLLEYGADINAQNKEGSTPLHMVSCDSDDSWIKFLHSHSADPNIGDIQERTPLFLIVEKGMARRVDYMIEKFGALINCRAKDGKTLVHAATKSKTVELPMNFIKKGLPFKMPDRYGSRVIHIAADCGHVDLVKNLLTRGEEVDSQNNDGYTPLHVAARAGRNDIAEVLIANRASVDIVALKGLETPLHLAARSPSGLPCAKLLIKSGAKINTANQDGMTPVMIAAEAGNTETVNLFLEHEVNIDLVNQSNETVLHIAVRSCQCDITKSLVDTIKEWRSVEGLKTFANFQNKTGETCLHYAASLDPQKKSEEARRLTKLLLESGCSILIENFEKKETPVHYCCRLGATAVLEEIITATSTTDFPFLANKPSKNGFTPILHACHSGHADIIQLLLEQFARVDVFDEKGRAGLHLAAELGHQSVVDILLQNNAFVGVRNKQGMTPLHIVSKNGFTVMVKELVTRYKAQIDAVTLTKQTPLHLASEQGRLETCATLLELGADIRAIDNRNQTPLHLAAESNHSDVFKLFLEKNPELITSVNGSGLTCGHIAAGKGSVAVIEELLKFDKESIIKSKIPETEATALHEAAAKGYSEVVKILLEAGASPIEEDKEGMTPLHLAAKFGHVEVFRVLKEAVDLKMHSRKNGLTALHIAASHGQSDFVIELLAHVPGGIASVKGSIEPNAEFGVTPLHLAAKNGHESVVRLLMNSTGVQVNLPTKINETIPMHYAAEGGHMIVAGLLISRSSESLTKPDKHGKTCLHLAAAQGHLDMISMLLGQGAEINAVDKKGWTPLHHAARNGYLTEVKLLVENGADPDAVNNDGKNAICLATASGHISVLSYLLTIEHDSLVLIDDKAFLLDLMFCSKNHDNKPIEEFILHSDSPIYIAVKLARAFENLANRNKDKSRDLLAASVYCDKIAIELLNIISTNYGTSQLLRALDLRSIEFLDVLIELERKTVVSQHAVQKYLSKVWIGSLGWTSLQFTLFFGLVLFCPLVWIVISTPIKHKLHSIPIIKFMSYLVAHIYFIILLASVILFPPLTIAYYNCCLPQWPEWFLLIWMIGLLVSEKTNPRDKTGLGNIKMIIIVLGFVGILMHIGVFALNLFLHDYDVISDEYWFTRRSDILYLRNQVWAWAMLFSFIDFLNFLTVHPLFGPWGVIIVELIGDLIKFVAVLMIFLIGFTLHVCAIYQPVYRTHINHSFPIFGQSFIFPSKTGEMLLWALFGLVQLEEMPPNHLSPVFSQVTMKTVFGIYMLITIVVLINLLIAMMSNTYQRIEEQSDIEWKFGRAKLIQNMNRTLSTPSPLNLFIGLPILLSKRRTGNDKADDFRAKSARTIYSTSSRRNSLDVDDAKLALRRASMLRRGSKASIMTSKTVIDEPGRSSQKTINNVVNWPNVVHKYYEALGLAKPEEADGNDDEQDN